jgi:hypothetical protein
MGAMSVAVESAMMNSLFLDITIIPQLCYICTFLLFAYSIKMVVVP